VEVINLLLKPLKVSNLRFVIFSWKAY